MTPFQLRTGGSLSAGSGHWVGQSSSACRGRGFPATELGAQTASEGQDPAAMGHSGMPRGGGSKGLGRQIRRM